MPTLYVTEQGAQVAREYRRLVVTRDDETLLAIPLERVTQVVLAGRVGITTPALHALLRQGADLALLDSWGRPLGRLSPPQQPNLPLRRRQYACAADPAFCLEVAKAIAAGKLRNYRSLARRLARNRPTVREISTAPLARLSAAIAACARAEELNGLRGVEGSGSRAYFALFRRALEGEMSFARRSRRPPRDPTNALLSLGYTLLAQACISACEIAGLDPHDGFYHADRAGRPALALDLMEEFRGVIVDSVVLNLANRGMLGPDDFTPGPGGGLYLRPAAMRVFFRRYTARLQAQVRLPGVGHPLTYQKLLEVQARKLRAVIEGQERRYTPFFTR